MAYDFEFKRLSEVENLTEVPEDATVLVEVDGSIKRISKHEVGGKGTVKSVNGAIPDEAGNVELETAASWNELKDKPFGEEIEVNDMIIDSYQHTFEGGSGDGETLTFPQLRLDGANFNDKWTNGEEICLLWNGVEYTSTVEEYSGKGHSFLLYFDCVSMELPGGSNSINEFRIDPRDIPYEGQDTNLNVTFSLYRKKKGVQTLDVMYLPEALQIGEENTVNYILEPYNHVFTPTSYDDHDKIDSYDSIQQEVPNFSHEWSADEILYVMWNNVEYEVHPYYNKGAWLLYVGEPRICTITLPTIKDSFIYVGIDKEGFGVEPQDYPTEVPVEVSVYTKETVIKTLDEKYLPETISRTNHNHSWKDIGEKINWLLSETEYTGGTILMSESIKVGKTYIISVNDYEYEGVASEEYNGIEYAPCVNIKGAGTIERNELTLYVSEGSIVSVREVELKQLDEKYLPDSAKGGSSAIVLNGNLNVSKYTEGETVSYDVSVEITTPYNYENLLNDAKNGKDVCLMLFNDSMDFGAYRTYKLSLESIFDGGDEGNDLVFALMIVSPRVDFGKTIVITIASAGARGKVYS